jgi:hypothetical protein
MGPGRNCGNWLKPRILQMRAMQVFYHDAPVQGTMKDNVGYWAARLQEPKVRALVGMAVDYFTLPAISAEPDRTYRRSQLNKSVNLMEPNLVQSSVRF